MFLYRDLYGYAVMGIICVATVASWIVCEMRRKMLLDDDNHDVLYYVQVSDDDEPQRTTAVPTSAEGGR